MEKNSFIRRLDALESKAFIDKTQYKTIVKISIGLFLILCVSLVFKNNILSLLRHQQNTTATVHKDVQTIKIATAE